MKIQGRMVSKEDARLLKAFSDLAEKGRQLHEKFIDGAKDIIRACKKEGANDDK